MATSPTTTTLTYRGETEPRKRWLAVFLSYLCPGLGYMYIGHILKGITVNLLFVLLLELFVILLSTLKFFPLLPILVLVVAWLLFSTRVAANVLELMAPTADEYIPKAYNHWILYAVVFLLTYLTPIAVTTQFTTRYLWTLAPMQTGAMYPAIEPGDTLLIDRSVYRTQPIKRGDLVAVRAPNTNELTVLRVIAMPGDIVSIEGINLYLNDELVQSLPLEPEHIQYSGFATRPDMYTWIEQNNPQSYVISLAPNAMHALEMPPVVVPEGHVFLLSDNRSQIPFYEEPGKIRDSRVFGPVAIERIEGKPSFISWSVHPGTQQVRWGRIGLRMQ